jgi:hypothetical protein
MKLLVGAVAMKVQLMIWWINCKKGFITMSNITVLGELRGWLEKMEWAHGQHDIALFLLTKVEAENQEYKLGYTNAMVHVIDYWQQLTTLWEQVREYFKAFDSCLTNENTDIDNIEKKLRVTIGKVETMILQDATIFNQKPCMLCGAKCYNYTALREFDETTGELKKIICLGCAKIVHDQYVISMDSEKK